MQNRARRECASRRGLDRSANEVDRYVGTGSRRFARKLFEGEGIFFT